MSSFVISFVPWLSLPGRYFQDKGTRPVHPLRSQPVAYILAPPLSYQASFAGDWFTLFWCNSPAEYTLPLPSSASLLSCFLLHSLRHQDGSESRDDCQGQAPTGLVTWFSGHYRPIPCNQFRSAIPLPYCIFLLFLYPISWPLLPSPQLCSHLRSASTPWSGAVSRSRAGHQLSPGLWGWSGALLPRSLWGRFQVGRSHPKSASRSRMFIPPGRAYRAWFQGHFSGGSNEVRCRIIQPVWHKSNHLLDLVAGLLLSLLEGWLAEYFEELFAAVIGWFVAGLA